MQSVHWLLDWLSLPGIGLPAIFVVSFVSATLLPLGSEPVVFAYVSVARDMFWPAVVVATVGNTLGGITCYAMGWGAQRAVARWHERPLHGARPGDGTTEISHIDGASADTRADTKKPSVGGKWHAWSSKWLIRLGPAALLFSWLPGVGDPLCAVAGYLRLSFWLCVLYMAIGKFLRYATITAALLWGWTTFAG